MTIVVSTKLSDLTSGFRPVVQLSGGSTVQTCERELTYVPDKGRIVIFVIDLVLESGARRRNHTCLKYY